MAASDKPLRDDIHLLGDLLGETLRTQEGPQLLEMVERVRALAKSGRAGNSRDFEELATLLEARPAAEALPIARAFAHFLNLANIAEQHHRIRRRREYRRDPHASPQPGSCDEVFGRLRAGGIDADTLFKAVTALSIELVITAHPTEVTRRTLLQRYRRIAELLAVRDHLDLTAEERDAAVEDLRREITAAWETDEVRHERQSPVDEVKGGLFVFEQTLWNAVPQFLRALDSALRKHTGHELPLEATPIRFGSWIGGDRDGNPNVTAAVTREACLLSRWVALDLYVDEIDALRVELSMARGSEELEALAGCSREPYRALLKQVRSDLRALRTEVEQLLGDDSREAASSFDLLSPLMACHRSLHETGNGILAVGRLLDLIRRVQCFGLTMVRLDVRQDSARHTALLGAITRAGGAGNYEEWDEDRRLTFLLESPATLPSGLSLDEENQEVLETFNATATIDREALGAYVITMTRQPSDILAVDFLQRLVLADSGRQPLRIVPLFETIADLENAGESVRRLLSIDSYRRTIGGRQEVMVGYSDSSKDAGRLAAAWHLYTAQERIVDACREAGIELTLFHGRGGSVGRGGGPTYLAIASQPPGSIEGRLRVTVQGEMIQAEFGLAGIALRTLEVYTTATLDATLDPPEQPRPEWRTTMGEMAAASARAYRQVVYESPAFLEYFRQATPEVELGGLNIGSRPARRAGAKKGVDSLRAIPWQFAWTQNRLLLPSWLGVDDGIAAADYETLRTMYAQWPFFRSTIDLIEMILAKAEAVIAAHYDRLLVAEELRPVGEDLRRRLGRCIDEIRRVTGHDHLLESNPVLRRSIDVRNPYVDPINVVQAEILRRYRASGDEALRDAFVVTVNGIAAGMRNTG